MIEASRGAIREALWHDLRRNETDADLMAFTNARGVLYHSPLIDPGVKYPPYSAHKLERKIVKKLM